MEHEIKIKIKWEVKGTKEIDITNTNTEALKDDGFARAFEMIDEGYREGELCSNIVAADGKSLEVHGWWSVEHSCDLKESEQIDNGHDNYGLEPIRNIADRSNKLGAEEVTDEDVLFIVREPEDNRPSMGR